MAEPQFVDAGGLAEQDCCCNDADDGKYANYLSANDADPSLINGDCVKTWRGSHKLRGQQLFDSGC
jgi:hypothetical protein